MTASTRHTVAGKVAVLLIAAFAAGYAMNNSAEKRVEEGKLLTIEQYTDDFEAHRAKQTKPPIPLWGGTAVFLFMLGAFLGVYEALGRALGVLIQKTGLLPDRPDRDGDESGLPDLPGHDLSISFWKMNALALPASPILIAPILVPFWLIWGTQAIRHGFEAFFVAPVFFLVLLVSIVIHEGLHGLGFIWFGRLNWSQIKFGVKWRYLAPFANAVAPMRASAYRGAGALPGVFLGVIPGVAAIVNGNGWLLMYALLMTSTAIGDTAILWLTRSLASDTMVIDHPSRVGCWVLDENPEESPASASPAP